MPNYTKKLISIGRFGSPHGVKGRLKVNSYTEPSENILNYQPWLIKQHGRYLPVKIISHQQDKDIIVQLENCNDRNLASTFTNCEILIERSQLKPLPADEYYWADLEGLTVFTKEGQNLGIVDAIVATGANDVLIVVGDKRRLIPFLIPQVILNIALETHQIIVNWDPDF